MLAALLLASPLAPVPAAHAKDGPKRVAPADAPRGEVCEWTSGDGVEYRFRVPKSYDPEKGAGLTFVLHGSNLTRGWGFANHRQAEFRPDDVVVCPDGTTSNGRGGFNFLQGRSDLDRFGGLHDELRKAFKVNGTYLYGHSQGSFFAHLYAAHRPGEVDGYVAHASAVWAGTALGRKGHHQAIVVMHGTADPVVWYEAGLGARASLEDAKYPTARLRSLEGWNHWPSEHNGSIGNVFVRHTSQQLAWVEGMTSDDWDRVTVCFEFLSKVEGPEWHDFAALRSLAVRIEAAEDAPAKLVSAAKKARAAVDRLAEAHVKSLRKPLGRWKKRTEPPDDPAPAHLMTFLRDFDGVPAAGALREAWEKTLQKHEKAAGKALDKRWKASRKGDRADAFRHGLAAAENGFLDARVLNWRFLNAMRDVHAKAEEHGLSKKQVARYDELFPRLRTMLEKGVAEFMKVNRSKGRL